MLINDYEVEVFTPPCDPEAVRFAARAHLGTDITPALPYLNAVLKAGQYNPAAPALVWKKGGHIIVFHPEEIATSNLLDRDEAEGEIKELIDLVNQTWARRDEIEPSEAVKQRPSHLAIYKLLPGTNCQQCGESTCYNFALKITTGQADLSACPALAEPDYRSARVQLADMLGNS